MSTKEARWLEKDGVVNFFLDADAARAEGAKEPDGLRSNGQPWNPPTHPGEGEPQADAVAAVAGGIAKAAATKAKRESGEQLEALKAAENAKPAKAK